MWQWFVSSEIDLPGLNQVRLEQFVREADQSIIVPGYTLMGWLGLGRDSFAARYV
jgi:hypothetical protein